jgi:hypothetical protein
MAVGTVSGIDLDENWQLITTATPSSASSVTFNSFSGYKKLMIAYKVSQSTASNLRAQFNGDTTVNNYGSAMHMYGTYGTWNGDTEPYLYLMAYGSAPASQVGFVVIENVDKTIPKILTGGGQMVGASGVWMGTSAITSIVISGTSGTFSGTIYLYGIAA